MSGQLDDALSVVCAPNMFTSDRAGTLTTTAVLMRCLKPPAPLARPRAALVSCVVTALDRFLVEVAEAAMDVLDSGRNIGIALTNRDLEQG